MSSVSSRVSLVDELHEQALSFTQRYHRAEADLLEILPRIDQHRVYLHRVHASLFAYVTRELGLSEAVAYSLITVARKAKEVPALKMELQTGSLTLSNARRVSAVLTPENQSVWIPKASPLTNRQLEKEIAEVGR